MEKHTAHMIAERLGRILVDLDDCASDLMHIWRTHGNAVAREPWTTLVEAMDDIADLADLLDPDMTRQ